jgi:hypothetical protein
MCLEGLRKPTEISVRMAVSRERFEPRNSRIQVRRVTGTRAKPGTLLQVYILAAVVCRGMSTGNLDSLAKWITVMQLASCLGRIQTHFGHCPPFQLYLNHNISENEFVSFFVSQDKVRNPKILIFWVMTPYSFVRSRRNIVFLSREFNFNPEDEDTMFLLNVGIWPQNYTVSQRTTILIITAVKTSKLV